MESYDYLVERYLDDPTKVLSIFDRRSTCVFVDGTWCLHVNGRALITYASKAIAINEGKRLTKKYKGLRIEFQEEIKS